MDSGARPITVYTIGFTQKSAEEFFTRLKLAGVKRVIDIRLKNESQLAGFSKKPDLAFFLREIGDIDYAHEPDLAPTPDILDKYKKRKGDWQDYEARFLDLIRQRKVEEKFTPEFLDESCLLCSEPTPEHCHRRLVAEYLRESWGDVNITHL
jgi:uncharacterized protein (DUF488 family)